MQVSTQAWLLRFVRLLGTFALRRADKLEYESHRVGEHVHTRLHFVGVGLQVIVLALLVSLLLILLTFADALLTSPSPIVPEGKSLSARHPPTGGSG